MKPSPPFSMTALEKLAKLEQNYISQGSSSELYHDFLAFFLELTSSQAGYLALVIPSKKTEESIKIIEVINLPIELKNSFFVKSKSADSSQLDKLEDLINKNLNNNQAIILNELNFKSAKVKNYLGIPLFNSTGLNALIGLFDRENGYDQSIVETIEPFIKAFSTIVESSTRQKKMLALLDKDALTQTYSRRYFEDQLELLSQDKQAFALIKVDINNFKKINNQYGHNFGDKLLIVFSDHLSVCLSEEDFMARLGGDEFIIFLRNKKDLSNTLGYIQKILSFSNTTYEVEGKKIDCRASVGFVSYPSDGKTPAELMKHADFALFEAKKNPEHLAIFTEALNEQYSRRIELEATISQAFDQGEFYAVYQPQVDIRNKKIVGFELLIRWKNPKLGEISPSEFIPIIEQLGLSEKLNHYVLQKLLNDLPNFSASIQKNTCIKISMNLSPKLFKLDSHLKDLLTLIKNSHYNQEKIKLGFEITESNFVDATNTEEKSVKEAINALVHQGVLLIIDDFGVKYSSISRLIEYPFNAIKIDQSFTQRLDKEFPEPAKATIRAIVSFGKDLHCSIIAEGAETEAQINVLQELNCNLVQGFYFYKPLFKEEAIKLIETQH